MKLRNIPKFKILLGKKKKKTVIEEGGIPLDFDRLGSDGDEEEGIHHLGADEVGEFIVDQGGEQEALDYLEAMRQEIYDLMAEEDEEIQFAKDNPEYTTRTFDDKEEDV